MRTERSLLNSPKVPEEVSGQKLINKGLLLKYSVQGAKPHRTKNLNCFIVGKLAPRFRWQIGNFLW